MTPQSKMSYADELTTAQKSKVIEELKGEKEIGL